MSLFAFLVVVIAVVLIIWSINLSNRRKRPGVRRRRETSGDAGAPLADRRDISSKHDGGGSGGGGSR